MRVVRPVVRQFKAAFAREAAAYVRAGGHALVWESPSRVRMVFPPPKDGDDYDLALWSLLDLGTSRWTRAKSGPYRGLGTRWVASDCVEIVRHRAERDSVHPGPTRAMELDCLACGACCKDNEVILWDDDVERFRKAGRMDLTRAPYARKRKDGKVVLTLLKSKDCRHLQADNKCAIYAIRPDSCSMFPMASEPCLFSREEELGLVDGVGEA